MFAHMSGFFHFHGEMAAIAIAVLGGFFLYRLVRKKSVR